MNKNEKIKVKFAKLKVLRLNRIKNEYTSYKLYSLGAICIAATREAIDWDGLVILTEADNDETIKNMGEMRVEGTGNEIGQRTSGWRLLG